MGGGDDLGSDEEFIDQRWMAEEKEEDASSTSSNHEPKQTGKRKKSAVAAQVHQDTILPTKKMKTKSTVQMILETGRQISNDTTDIQAAFINTCFTHFLHDASGQRRKFIASDMVQSREKSLADKIKSRISTKRMKKWKVLHCPLVLIVCSSARRAVALLKEIDSLHVRIAKLFAKHLDMEDQRKDLDGQAYAIAVGTPNRLLKLCETVQQDSNTCALHFRQTELVVIDSWEDSKRFTVCTLNDTAPDLMRLLDTAIIPQIQERPNLKLAFF
jgi:hypothetical protein